MIEVVLKYRTEAIVLEKLTDEWFLIKVGMDQTKYVATKDWIYDFNEVDVSKLMKYDLPKTTTKKIEKVERRLPKGVDTLVIQKLDYLEERLSNKYKYKIIKDVYVTSDIENIKCAVLEIAKHLNIDDYNFHIELSYTQQNHAGHIYLQNFDKNVQIVLSIDILDSNEAILCTLSHELIHKFLHTNRVSLAVNYENEVLTDMGAIYMGLGKLMLNGYETEINTVRNLGQTVETITKKSKLGYLSLDKLVQAYVWFSYKNNISYNKMKEGINKSKLRIINSIINKDYYYYKKWHRQIETSKILKYLIIFYIFASWVGYVLFQVLTQQKM